MTQNNGNSEKVTVIGLGLMGTVLARLLIKKGYQVTVWNRTVEKATALVEEGAVVASVVAQAISASPLVVVCVYDYAAANEILRTPEVASELAGKTIIQLTTGGPQEARESEAWALRQGADYLDGAILAAPQQMGNGETMILVSGAERSFERSREILNVFAGKPIYLGTNAGSASAMDLAVLSYTYGAALGFFHGVRIGEVEGFDADSFGAIIKDFSSTIGDFVKFESELIRKGDFTVSESSIGISVEAVERILKTAQESGINTEFPNFAAGIFRQAKRAGYAGEELAALIKVFREPEGSPKALKGGINV